MVEEPNKNENTKGSKIALKKIALLGMLAAISIVLAYLVHLPILPSAPFLEYDPADIPILIASFALGPWWGLALTLVVSVVQGLTVSASGGWWGILMHFVSTGVLAVTAGLIYKSRKTRTSAFWGLMIASIAMLIVMIPLNIFIDPLYLGADVNTVIALLPTAIIPFNAIKASINAIVTFVVYKEISKLMHKWL